MNFELSDTDLAKLHKMGSISDEYYLNPKYNLGKPEVLIPLEEWYELTNKTLSSEHKNMFQERWQELQSLENNRLAEQESVRKEKALKAVEELLIFIDTCTVSDYAPWREFEREEMSKIILKHL